MWLWKLQQAGHETPSISQHDMYGRMLKHDYDTEGQEARAGALGGGLGLVGHLLRDHGVGGVVRDVSGLRLRVA